MEDVLSNDSSDEIVSSFVDQAVFTALSESLTIPKIFENFKSQENLQGGDFHGLLISDEDFKELGKILFEKNKNSLKFLNLSENNLTDKSSVLISDLIFHFPKLECIFLQKNKFSFSSIGNFFTAIYERNLKSSLSNKNLNFSEFQFLDLQEEKTEKNFDEKNSSLEFLECRQKILKFLKIEKVSFECVERIFNFENSLWNFLCFTNFPKIQKSEKPNWQIFDSKTLKKFSAALTRIILFQENNILFTAGCCILPPLSEPYENFTDIFILSKILIQTKEMQILSKTENSKKTEKRKSKDFLLENEIHKIVPLPPQQKLSTFNFRQILNPKSNSISIEVLDRLLESTSIDATDIETGKTLLEFACENGQLNLVKHCYRKKANLKMLTRKGESVLNIAMKNKFYRIVEFLVIYGVKVNFGNSKGITPLHLAASLNDIDGICRLIELGCDVNILDSQKRSALHHAAMNGHLQSCLFLLEIGCNFNAEDDKNFTAVGLAEANDHFKLMDRLIELGGKMGSEGERAKGTARKGGKLKKSNSVKGKFTKW